MSIITKFTVASGQGMEALLLLTEALAIQKFSPLLERKTVDQYIARHFNLQALTGEVNNMSNQWLVVYVNDAPAGYARITSKGKRPPSLEGKRAIRIADFGILSQYAAPEVSASLLAKCLSVCDIYEGIWINEYTGNPLIPFFESKGFTRQPDACQLDELPLPSVCLIACK